MRREFNKTFNSFNKGQKMERVHNQRAIVLISESTGERVDFDSINAAARFIGANFSAVQRAAMYNGTYNGWRVYESPESIRQHIKDLEAQLEILEG